MNLPALKTPARLGRCGIGSASKKGCVRFGCMADTRKRGNGFYEMRGGRGRIVWGRWEISLEKYVVTKIEKLILLGLSLLLQWLY